MRRRLDGVKVKKASEGVVKKINVVLVLALLALLVVTFWRSSAGSVWENDAFYKVVVVGDDFVSVVGVNVVEDRGVELVIPGNAMVPVVGTQGELRIGSIWEFGDGEGRAEEIVGASLEKWLGIKVNAVWRVNGNMEVDWMDAWSSDDGVLMDRLRLVKARKKFRDDQEKSVRIPGSLMEVEINPDGEEVLIVDSSRLRTFAEDLWQSAALLDEGVGLEILNSSGETGMGRLMEAMARAEGALVTDIETSEDDEGYCWFSVENEDKNALVVRWLSRQMRCKHEKKEDSRSGVVRLWVGEEWADSYR